MKEFFIWCMAVSIVGVWPIMAYAFYRISRISGDIYDISFSKANVRSTELSLVAIDKAISAINDKQAELRAELMLEISNRLQSFLTLRAIVDENSRSILFLANSREELTSNLSTLEKQFLDLSKVVLRILKEKVSQ